jgi:hypothetical protein
MLQGMSYGELAPRGGTPITDEDRLLYLATHMHTFDDYGVDRVSICLGTLPEETGAYILTRSAERFWAWSFEDPELAAASFRHFHASPYNDWAYCATDGGLLTLIARHGLLPQLQLDAAPPETIRFFRSPEGCQTPQTPVLLRFPWPNEAQYEEGTSVDTDSEGFVHHNVWLTAQIPHPLEIDLQLDEEWIPMDAVDHSLQVTAEIARLAAELGEPSA